MYNAQLSIMQCNTRSIKDKCKQLAILEEARKNNIDIISLNETWLKEKDAFNLNNFNCFRKDRSANKGGGVAILCHSSLKTKKLFIPHQFQEVECVAVEISTNETQVQIFSIYNPPNKNMNLEFMKWLCESHKNFILVGDLNACHYLWHDNRINQRGLDLIELIDKFNLKVVNSKKSTYIPSHGILDLTICSEQMVEFFSSFHIGNDIGSDHFPTIARFKINTAKNFSKIVIKWKMFKSKLKEKELPSINSFSKENFNEKVHLFQKSILETYEASKMMTKKPKFQGISDKVRKLIVEKRQLRRAFQSSRDPEIKTKLNKIIKTIQLTIEKQNIDKWEKICASQDSATIIWNKIRSMQTCISNEKITLVRNGETINEDPKIANVFGEKLSNVFSLETNNFNADKETVGHKSSSKTDLRSTNFDLISIEEIISNLKASNQKSAPGEDKITYKMLSELPTNAVQAICDIFNYSILNGIIPDLWKVAKIKMLLKSGKSPTDETSYRPISLLSNLGKLLEKIINNRLTKFLETNSLISKYQSGFRKAHSTKDQILRLVQSTKEGFNKNQITGAVFFDISQAFDKTWHNGIRVKLSKLKVPKYIQNWISEFLTNRTFFVACNEAKSRKFPITAGVPQGSTLSPTLFTIFISDIANRKLKKLVNIALYADDLCIWFTDKNLRKIQKQLNKAIKEVGTFFDRWCLVPNADKTVYSIFTTAGKRETYEKIYSIDLELNSKKIKLEANPKFLGIKLDPKMSFKKHTEELEKNVEFRLFILRALNKKLKKTKLSLSIYKTLIRSLIEYGHLPLLSSSAKAKDSIQKIQNKAIRICLKLPKSTCISTLHKLSNIEPIEERLNRLSQSYISKANANNKSIAELCQSYLNKKELNDGKYVKNRKPIFTPLTLLFKEKKTL